MQLCSTSACSDAARLLVPGTTPARVFPRPQEAAVGGGVTGPRQGAVRTAANVLRTEGVRGLYSGAAPSSSLCSAHIRSASVSPLAPSVWLAPPHAPPFHFRPEIAAGCGRKSRSQLCQRAEALSRARRRHHVRDLEADPIQRRADQYLRVAAPARRVGESGPGPFQSMRSGNRTAPPMGAPIPLHILPFP